MEHAEKPVPVLHLTFIDGMRGLAAVFVVLHHAFQPYQLEPPRFTGPLCFLFSHGHEMVTVFIAISGFCLMLPIVRGGMTLEVPRFFKKRARRILPPYYAALALAILVDVWGRRKAVPLLAYLREPLTQLSLWSHVFLFHNWYPKVMYSFDGPLWSIAVECQIYLLFPLLILSWRRMAAGWTLLWVGAATYAGWLLLNQVVITYVFVFALGMVGAELVTQGRRYRWLTWLCAAAFAGYCFSGNAYLSDVLVGAAAVSLMTVVGLGGMPIARRLLSLKALTWLGGFSYSIYLIHYVVQIVFFRFFLTHFRGLASPSLQLALIVLGVTPVVIMVAYVFHLLVEKPFMSASKSVDTPRQPRFRTIKEETLISS